MGLLQLTPNGKARLIPITILYDGEFYDASAYKAAPVPMALESGTVYEAVSTGVSQGLFTVSNALQMRLRRQRQQPRRKKRARSQLPSRLKVRRY